MCFVCHINNTLSLQLGEQNTSIEAAIVPRADSELITFFVVAVGQRIPHFNSRHAALYAILRAYAPQQNPQVALKRT